MEQIRAGSTAAFQRRLLVIADGMGGEAAGDVASRLCVDSVVRHLGSAALDPTLCAHPVSVVQVLREAFAAAQSAVLDAAASTSAWSRMGSALLVACVLADTVYTCHVGDVRCYCQSNDHVELLTSEHSVVAELLRAKAITPEQAVDHPQKGIVTQAVGHRAGIKPDVNSRHISPGDRILLCTDGLWGSLTDAELVAVLHSDGSTRELAIVLADRANAAGGADNCTLILYELN
jgi:protein phosphatase